MREEIAHLIEEGVAKKDMERIQAQIRASFLFQDEAVLDLAMKLGRFEAGTPEGFRTLATVLPTYESLTQKELREVAAKYLDFDRAAVVWAIPASGPAKGKGKGKGKGKAKQAKAAKKVKRAVLRVPVVLPKPVAKAAGSGKQGKKAGKKKGKRS